MKLVVILTNMPFLILYNNKMCNLLKSPHSSVSLYFPNDQCMMLQNQKFMGNKDPFKVQNTMIDFHVTGYEKAVDGVSDSVCQLTFKHYVLLTFGVV